MASWLGPSAFTALARVQFLVRELRSHKPHSVAKKKKKKTCQMSVSLFFVSDSGTHLPFAWVRAGPWVTAFGIRQTGGKLPRALLAPD